MTKMWFRPKAPNEGQGYSIASSEGVIAAIVFVAAATVSAVLRSLIWGVSVWTITASILLDCTVVAVFLGILRRHTEWRG